MHAASILRRRSGTRHDQGCSNCFQGSRRHASTSSSSLRDVWCGFRQGMEAWHIARTTHPCSALKRWEKRRSKDKVLLSTLCASSPHQWFVVGATNTDESRMLLRNPWCTLANLASPALLVGTCCTGRNHISIKKTYLGVRVPFQM